MLLFTLLQIVHAEELYSFTIIGFDVDFSWQSTSVLKREVFCLLFAEDDISKVNLILFYRNKGFLTSTDKWDVNFAGLRQNREARVDILIQLWGKRDRNGR